MKKQFLLFASALLLTACSKPYSVTVDYGNKNDGMQVYLQNYFTGEIIDSTTFADGKAVFNGKTGKNYIAQATFADKSATFVLEPGDINITFNPAFDIIYEISGTEQNDSLAQILNQDIAYQFGFLFKVLALDSNAPDFEKTRDSITAVNNDTLRILYKTGTLKYAGKPIGDYCSSEWLSYTVGTDEFDEALSNVSSRIKKSAPVQKSITVNNGMKANQPGSRFIDFTIENGNRKVVIEIKSLNSKTLDLNLKMPNLYKEKEMEIRNIVKEQLDRGKVEMCIYFDNTESDKDVTINKPVVTQYFNQLLDIANELGIEADKNKILQTVMRFPDTLQIKSEELEDTEWEALEAGIKKALEEINKFRIQEGKALIKDICHRIELIQELSAQVPQFEVKRVEVIRQKLQEKINEWTDIQNIDENRLEQEIIYYLEKLDITEEKVRLANHCKYFLETIEHEDAPGRKIGFIAQEIGREINTMGSKANDHDIQKLVVKMKDELEKIKEQSLNVL